MRRAYSMMLCLTILVTACGARPPEATPPVYQTGVNPEAWAKVPAGEFLMGIHEERVTIPYNYDIMVTDVTNAQYAKYLNAALAAGVVIIAGNDVKGPYAGDAYSGKRHEKKIAAGDYLHVSLNSPDLRLTYDGNLFGVKAGYENHPVTMITWFGAKAYCDFYGGRLPSETEWEKAARGTDARPYPWGSGISGGRANFYDSADPFEQGIGALGNTTPVGFYNGAAHGGFQTLDAASPYGVYDMAGNVWQWMGDLTVGTHDRQMRGGSKTNYGYNLRVWTRNMARPDYASPSVGFRCVRSVR